MPRIKKVGEGTVLRQHHVARARPANLPDDACVGLHMSPYLVSQLIGALVQNSQRESFRNELNKVLD